MVTINYNFGKGHYLDYMNNFYKLDKSFRQSRRKILQRYTITVLMCSFIPLHIYSDKFFISLTYSLSFTLAYLLIIIASQKRTLNIQSHKIISDPLNQGMFGEKIITADEESITFSRLDQTSVSKFAWIHIENIVFTKRYIAFFITASSFYVIPKEYLKDNSLEQVCLKTGKVISY